MLTQLGQAALSRSITVNVLADVNMGMNRTGLPLDDLEKFCYSCAEIKGITLCGLHCYDGHRTEHDAEERRKISQSIDEKIQLILKAIQQNIPRPVPWSYLAVLRLFHVTQTFREHTSPREHYSYMIMAIL